MCRHHRRPSSDPLLLRPLPSRTTSPLPPIPHSSLFDHLPFRDLRLRPLRLGRSHSTSNSRLYPQPKPFHRPRRSRSRRLQLPSPSPSLRGPSPTRPLPPLPSHPSRNPLPSSSFQSRNRRWFLHPLRNRHPRYPRRQTRFGSREKLELQQHRALAYVGSSTRSDGSSGSTRTIRRIHHQQQGEGGARTTRLQSRMAETRTLPREGFRHSSQSFRRRRPRLSSRRTRPPPRWTSSPPSNPTPPRDPSLPRFKTESSLHSPSTTTLLFPLPSPKPSLLPTPLLLLQPLPFFFSNKDVGHPNPLHPSKHPQIHHRGLTVLRGRYHSVVGWSVWGWI